MNIGRDGGFKGGMRRQGGWIGAAIGLGTAIFASSSAKKAAKKQEKLAKAGIAAADPYAKYRTGDADKLQALMKDPTTIQNLPEYKARMLAAERTMAAQGYTGSGNALVEAANAGGTAYQQAFSNLAMTSGAGITPGGGYGNALTSGQNSTDNKLSGYTAIGTAGANLAQRFNTSVRTPTASTGGGGSYTPPGGWATFPGG